MKTGDKENASSALSSSPERRMLSRGLATLGDQVLASIFSLQLGFVAARVLSAEEFGIFASLFTALLIARGIVRGIALDPLTILHASDQVPEEAKIANSLVVCVGIATGLGACVATALGWLEPRVAISVFAAALTLLVVDSARMIDIASGRPGKALRLGTILLAASWFPLGLVLSAGSGLIELAAGVTVAAVLAIASRREPIRLETNVSQIRSWLRSTTSTRNPLLLDFAVIAGTGYAAIFLLAAIDIREAGSLRAAQMVAAPLFMVFTGITQLVMTEVARSPRDAYLARRIGLLSMIGGSVIALAHLAAVFFGREFFAALLGDTGPGATDTLVATSAMAALTLPSFVATGLLRGSGAAARVTRARLTAAPFVVAATIIGALDGGAVGVAIWGAVAQLVTLPLWFHPIRRYRLEHPS